MSDSSGHPLPSSGAGPICCAGCSPSGSPRQVRRYSVACCSPLNTLPTHSRKEPYDVCIVGSGAGGGMAAYMLTRAGANVVLLEAGGMWDNTRDSAMLKWAHESPRRGSSTAERPFGEFDACIGGWNVAGEPYTRAPGTKFDWWRARMLGGRTNHWGRISLRFGPDDFRGKSRDGLGEDWPISYDELKPWYDEVDRLIGIFGSNEGLPNHPDGIFLPPPKPRCWELLVKQAADRMKVTCIPSRLSILTKPHHGRAACHYCGQCNRGCAVNANFSSPNVLIFPAMETGRLTLVTGAMAREVTLDQKGRADGVVYIDKATRTERRVDARVVVLAASACESARLLLNSKSSRFPDGLANSSGVVGKYLTDTTGTDVGGFIPKMMDHVPHNEDGVGGAHLYMPWWIDNKKLDFPRGYHIEIWGGLSTPSYGFMGGIQNYPSGGGYGRQLKDDYRRYYGATIGFSGRGEQIPNEDCYCEIDPDMVDQWGIPVLRFHWKWSDHEYNQVKHMQETFRSLIAEMGGEVWSPMPTREQGYGISNGGSIIHELGTVRMGSDPKRSVVNAQCQAWDVKTLFVADGGPFVSQADKNPTWTILALSMRASDYISGAMKRGEL
ncbi:MAG: GMC family oxidoreductase [Gemmatimonadales bacterium]|nr:MAG: GMC family oxidoreductase [Gemmatimonadales bacterium]